MNPVTPPEVFTRACDDLGIELSAEDRDRLGQFLQVLLETNRQFNLTAIRDPDEAWMRHILDSLSLLPCLGDAQTLIDIGSGGGLPGMVLAITQPQLRVTLLEATGKKARFLRSAAEGIGLGNVTVVNDRAEAAAHKKEYRERYDLATARAIGPMNVMLEYTLPFIRVGGRLLAMKGRKLEEELREAGDALMLLGGGEVSVYDALPGIEQEAVIVEVVKDHSTPRQYPRSPGTPRLHPL